MKKLLSILTFSTLLALPFTAHAENLEKCITGWNSTQMGEHGVAISLFESCIQKGNLSNKNLARTYRNLGIAYNRSKDFNNAIVSYNKAIALNPEDVFDDYVNRGNAYDGAGKFAEALADYETALSLKPNYGEAYYNRGVAYEHNKMYDKALADFFSAYKSGLRTKLLYERFVVYGVIKG